MDLRSPSVIAILLILEVVQLVFIWLFVRYRYQNSLKQIVKLTRQLTAGERPRTYYIDGPPAIQQLSRHLETLGSLLEQFERQQREEEFNLNVLLANMVEGV